MIHFLPTVGTSGESAFRTTWGWLKAVDR
jgi:hypothetical protein